LPSPIESLFNFFVPGVLAARVAKLLGLQAFGVLLLVFCGRVVAVFAIAALQRNGFSHRSEPFQEFPRNTPRLLDDVRDGAIR
jgi:hypothetical protein